jgi:hypothetical protein
MHQLATQRASMHIARIASNGIQRKTPACHAPGCHMCRRSNDIYLNNEAGNFSEIDVEWLNGNPAKEPGSLWFNAFTE